MRYDFLIDSYDTERIKTLSVWSEFRDDDLRVRPRTDDARGRSVLEHFVHQCISENNWFRDMLGIDVDAPPLPAIETRIEFIRRYAEDSSRRVERLRGTDDAWWESSAMFFAVARSRAWIMTRRLAHTAHHRGQQTAMLRMLGRSLHSTYGRPPTPEDWRKQARRRSTPTATYLRCSSLKAVETTRKPRFESDLIRR